MLRESSVPRSELPRRTFGTSVPRKFGRENLSKFGIVCEALWPNEKHDIIISTAAGCTERAARQYLRGERNPSLDALLVIINEIRGRRGT